MNYFKPFQIQLTNAMFVFMLIFLIGSACAGGTAPNGKKWNILFLSLDDLRPELGCYGADYVISPNIDKLAAQGVTFTQAYCQQAICNPSRASLLTGYYPDQINVWDLPTHFRDVTKDVVTLPQYFKANGYYTVFTGKIFHPGHDDLVSWNEPSLHRQEKSKWRSYSDPVTKKFNRLKAKAKKDGTSFWEVIPPAMEAVPDSPDSEWVDAVMAKAAIKKLQQLAKMDQPFFLAVGFSQTHLPFTCPKKYWDLYDPQKIPKPLNPNLPRNAPDMALNTASFLRAHADLRERGVGAVQDGPMPEDLAQELRHGYLACTTFMDKQVGRVVDELDRLGLRENTIICLWGDHGWKLGEHQGWSKMTNFDIDTRCPLIISYPGAKGGVNVKQSAMVEFVDLYPTLADLAGLDVPKDLPGKSLRPLLDQPGLKWENAAMSQYLRGGMITESYDHQMHMGYTIRTSEFRYTEWYAWDPKTKTIGKLEARELYDHRKNDLENENVADNPEYKKFLEIMIEKLADKRAGIAQKPAPTLRAKPKQGKKKAKSKKVTKQVRYDVDLRPEFLKRGLPARDQGKRGACQVFGMTAGIEYHLSKPGAPVDLSEQFLMWGSNQSRDISLKEGFNPDVLISGLRRFGICEEKLMLYEPRLLPIKKPSKKALLNAQSRKRCVIEQIKHWSDDFGFSSEEIALICQHLDEGNPISVTLAWPFSVPDDQTVDQQNRLIDHKVQVDKNGHGVLIVGYRKAADVAGGGEFLIRNSWGSRFGDDGYARVTFEYAKKYGTNAYRVVVKS